MTTDIPVDERRTITHRFKIGATKIIANAGVLVADLSSDVRCIIYAKSTGSEAR